MWIQAIKWTGINFNMQHETLSIKPNTVGNIQNSSKLIWKKKDNFSLEKISYNDVKTNHGKLVRKHINVCRPIEMTVIYNLKQTKCLSMNTMQMSFRNVHLSKPHFTMWNGKIHVFHRIVILCVVCWYLQQHKTGVCFCQHFVWCHCKKGDCHLFFNDWKGRANQSTIARAPLVFLHPLRMKKQINTFSSNGSFAAQAMSIYSRCDNFQDFPEFLWYPHFVLN